MDGLGTRTEIRTPGPSCGWRLHRCEPEFFVRAQHQAGAVAAFDHAMEEYAGLRTNKCVVENLGRYGTGVMGNDHVCDQGARTVDAGSLRCCGGRYRCRAVPRRQRSWNWPRPADRPRSRHAGRSDLQPLLLGHSWSLRAPAAGRCGTGDAEPATETTQCDSLVAVCIARPRPSSISRYGGPLPGILGRLPHRLLKMEFSQVSGGGGNGFRLTAQVM